MGIGTGGGFISKVGNLNLLVIPYVDENGIKHAPKFQIKGLIRDKTKEWAQVIYEKLVELNKYKPEMTRKYSSEKDDVFEKLKKLKELHDAGVLTDDEFEEKKKKLLDKL